MLYRTRGPASAACAKLAIRSKLVFKTLLLHGPKNVHIFYFAVVSTNIDRFFIINLVHSILKEFATQQLVTCPVRIHTVVTLLWKKTDL